MWALVLPAQTLSSRTSWGATSWVSRCNSSRRWVTTWLTSAGCPPRAGPLSRPRARQDPAEPRGPSVSPGMWLLPEPLPETTRQPFNQPEPVRCEDETETIKSFVKEEEGDLWSFASWHHSLLNQYAWVALVGEPPVTGPHSSCKGVRAPSLTSAERRLGCVRQGMLRQGTATPDAPWLTEDFSSPDSQQPPRSEAKPTPVLSPHPVAEATQPSSACGHTRCLQPHRSLSPTSPSAFLSWHQLWSGGPTLARDGLKTLNLVVSANPLFPGRSPPEVLGGHTF